MSLVWCIHKVAQPLENNLIRFPDVVLFRHTIGVSHPCISKTLARYFQIVYPEIAHMSLHHITLAQHQYTTNGQFPVFRDAHLITELVIRQVLVGKRRILVTDLIPIRFQRALVEVIKACSLYHLFTLATKSLITHHRHHLRLSSTPVSAASPNESIDRITEVYRLHDR